MSISKHLRRVVLEKSIEHFITLFSCLLVNTDIEASDFNSQVRNLKRTASYKTRLYITTRFDSISRMGEIENIPNPTVYDTEVLRNVKFFPGTHSNISFDTSYHHNVQDDYDNVGRVDAMVEIMRFLAGQEVEKPELFKSYQSEYSYLNLFGITGMGKTTLMK